MIYLDNAATSFPKPECVKTALVDFLENFGANAGRSGHKMSIDAGKIIFDARLKIANLLNIKNPLNIAFTYNATHSLNLALHSIIKEGDIVVTSPYEHNSVKRVLNFLKEQKNIIVKTLEVDKFGHIINYEEALNGAKLICLMHANNVNGAIFPIKEIFSIAKKLGVKTLLDAAQSIGIVSIDMKDDFIDILCASGHKGLFGIQGTGILAINDGFEMETITPFIQGGTGSKSELEIQPNFMPDMLESGTQNGHGIASINAGIDFINKIGIENIFSHEVSLREFLCDEISKIDDLVILKTPNSYKSISNLSIVSKSMCVSDLANRLDYNGFLTRASLHCNPSTHKFYHTYPDGALRISPGFFNTIGELESLVKTLKEVLK